ncbi:MAG: TM1812 family CRISPR-associated protein [Nautiliaceae bacterium]
MKLIATLGTTKANYTHIYYLDNKEYREVFSFFALKKHFNIEDKNVIIIGTSETKKNQDKFIKNFEFVEVDADNFEDVFAKTLRSIENNSIVDLTQSFKSLGFGALLSYSFSKSIGKKVKDIYYAQVQENCNPGSSECKFVFQSLKKYEDIVELVREINLFINSWYVLNQEKDEDFKVIHNNLLEMSQMLSVNDLDIEDNVKNLKNEIDRLLNKKEYAYLYEHLKKLQEEILKIDEALDTLEYRKLIKFSRLYLEKNFLLQSLTMLFEAMSAYVEYKTKDNFVCKNKKGKFNKSSDKYQFRNCLKNKLLIVRNGYELPKYLFHFVRVDNLEDFANHFAKVDELRNNSAHAFINGKSEFEEKKTKFKDEIYEEINYFSKYIE